MRDCIPKRLKGMQSPSHARSKVQEKQIASQLGGKLTPRSGAGLVKGDVRVKGIARIEAKTTQHKSFSVTNEHIKALDQAVFGNKEIPMMSIEIMSGAYKFCVIPEQYLADIITALEYYDANKPD